MRCQVFCVNTTGVTGVLEKRLLTLGAAEE